MISRALLLGVLLFLPITNPADLLVKKCMEEAPLCENLAPHLEYVDYLLSRKPISENLEAVVMRSSARDEFGVFVVDRKTRKHVLTVAILPSHRENDYLYDLEAATTSSLVVRGFGSTYGDVGIRKKYFFDLKAKKVTAEFDKRDISIKHIEFSDGMVFLAGNLGNNRGALVVLTDVHNHPGTVEHRLITELNGLPLEPILAVRREKAALHFLSRSYRYAFSSGRWIVSKHEGGKNLKYDNADTQSVGFPDLRVWVPLVTLQENLITTLGPDGAMVRYLVWSNKVSVNAYGGEFSSGIYESRAGTIKFYPLPQPSFELFAERRPERVKQGYTKEYTRLENHVGPWQRAGKKILFGLQFYDGEGANGLGGYGQFDIETKKYELNYLPEIAEWSVSSLYVDDDLLWLGLSRQTEGFHPGNGLVAYNRKSGQIASYPTPGIVNVIRKWRDRIHVGTTQGIVIIGPDKVSTFTLDVDNNGRNYLVVNKSNQ